jgi:predicted nucleic acid-binding protein
VASASPAVGLIDTDILIDAERGHPDAIAFVTAQQAASGVRVSVVSAMELIVGSRNTFELTQVRRFLQSVLVIPLDPVISQTALGLVETHFLSHGLLIPDALIAASALAHGLPLYTKNARHFQMIPQLTVIRPYQ